MNNDFKNYLKKKEKRIDKFTLLVGIMVIALAILNILGFSILILLPLLFIVIVIYIVKNSRKEENKIKEYDLGMDIDTNIYIKLTYNEDYLKEIDKILGNSIQLEKCKNLVDYIQLQTEEKNDIFLEREFDLKEALSLLNKLLKHKKINYKLSYNDIIKDDDEIIKKRRINHVNTAFYDLAKIRYYLEKNGLELISFYASNNELSKKARVDGFLLTITEIENVDKLMKAVYNNSINI